MSEKAIKLLESWVQGDDEPEQVKIYEILRETMNEIKCESTLCEHDIYSYCQCLTCGKNIDHAELNFILMKKNHELKQWQREAVLLLEGYQETLNGFLEICENRDDMKLIIKELETLIKQAEEELTCDKTFTKNNLKKESK